MNDYEVRDLYDQVQRLEGQIQYIIEAMLGEECGDDCCCAAAEEE